MGNQYDSGPALTLCSFANARKGSLSHTWIILGDISLISFVLLSFIFLRLQLCSIAYANNNKKKYAQLCYLGHIFLKIKWAHLSLLLKFLPRQ